jgi:hypothetical protein
MAKAKMSENWDYLVLQTLSDGKSANLKMIYAAVAELPHINGMEHAVNPRLYGVNIIYGNRPKYTHIIRSTTRHGRTSWERQNWHLSRH